MHSFSRCALSDHLDSSSAISEPSVLAFLAAREEGGDGGMDGPLVVVMVVEVEVGVAVAFPEVSSSSSSSSSSSAAEVRTTGSSLAIFFLS